MIKEIAVVRLYENNTSRVKFELHDISVPWNFTFNIAPRQPNQTQPGCIVISFEREDKSARDCINEALQCAAKFFAGCIYEAGRYADEIINNFKEI